MAVVKTELRVTREAAKRIRYYPSAADGPTNVQDAIGSVIGAVVDVAAAASPYTPPANAGVLLVDTTAGPVTINLPLAASRHGSALLIKDKTGNAAVNNITINPTGPETIDGLATVVLSNPYAFFRAVPKTGGYYDAT